MDTISRSSRDVNDINMLSEKVYSIAKHMDITQLMEHYSDVTWKETANLCQVADFLRPRLFQYMDNKKLDLLPENLGFLQPRLLLRLSTSETWWPESVREYIKQHIVFTKEVFQEMADLRWTFDPYDCFTTLSLRQVVLLWVELERFAADEALIMFVILALKFRVLNPTRALTKLHLHSLIMTCAEIAIEQIVNATDIQEEYAVYHRLPASTSVIVKASLVPKVTESISKTFTV